MIDLKEYCHLLIFDAIVGNTWVVGIEFIYLHFKAIPKLLAVHQTLHNCSVYGILVLYKYLIYPLSICSHIGIINLWGNL